MYATPNPISWIIFILDSEPSYTDILFEFRWVHTYFAPFVADLFLYERDFMDYLNRDNQTNVIESFNSTSRYLDDLLNIDNPYFEGMANISYPLEPQLNKANAKDTKAPYLDLHVSVANGFFFLELLVCCLTYRGSNGVFLLLRISLSYLAQGSPSSGSYMNLRVLVFDSSWYSCSYHDLLVCT